MEDHRHLPASAELHAHAAHHADRTRPGVPDHLQHHRRPAEHREQSRTRHRPSTRTRPSHQRWSLLATPYTSGSAHRSPSAQPDARHLQRYGRADGHGDAVGDVHAQQAFRHQAHRVSAAPCADAGRAGVGGSSLVRMRGAMVPGDTVRLDRRWPRPRETRGPIPMSPRPRPAAPGAAAAPPGRTTPNPPGPAPAHPLPPIQRQRADRTGGASPDVQTAIPTDAAAPEPASPGWRRRADRGSAGPARPPGLKTYWMTAVCCSRSTPGCTSPR